VLSPRVGVDQAGALIGELTPRPVGLSEVYENLEHTPAALNQARIALRAAAVDGRGPVRYGQVPIGVLLASAPDAATMVANAILGPVLALPELECDSILTTLGVWFADEGSTSAAAERMHLHRNTVRYRLRRLEELTGRSLTQPTGVAELYLALEAVRVLRLRG
jgi:DNA-binding PucR family transcriptional regulator